MATAYEPQPEEHLPDSGAMSDDALAAHLAEHEMRAIGYFESEIANDQANALDRYYRRPYGDEQAGRSKVVDATVAITVDNALAAILKPFVSSDDTVIFEPRSEEDEEQARQATEYVNYVLHNDNCGFQIFHDWFKDALLQKVGVVKAYWEEYERTKPERLENLDAVQVQSLMQSEQVIDGPFGPDENGLYTLDILKTEKDGKCCIENIPPEEYRISPYARPGRTPPYEAHKTAKTRSELVEMGFDAEIVAALSKSSTAMDDQRMIARYQDEEFGALTLDQPGDKSRELVDFNDEFVLIDYDGDGVSELRRVMRSGTVILYNEEVDDGPFARLCPVPMPHKIYGQSLADQVIDEQRIATVLWRQTLDNLYLSNNPRPMVPEAAERTDGSTFDDLADDSPGAVIRVKAEPLLPFSIPFVADKSFPMLEYVASQAEARTGISKHGQGMDPDAIDTAGQVTATQSAIMEDGRNARSELVARIFAETGIKDLFKKILRLVVQHQPRARVIRLRNKWVEMDPRSWNADMDLSISVGLGIGNKAQQIAVADGILQTIAMAKQDPAAATLFPLEKVFNAIKRKFVAAGIKSTDEFIQEPQRDQQGNVVEPQTPPDPETMKAQAELQMKDQDLKHKQSMAELDKQIRAEDAQQKLDLMRAEKEEEAILARQRLDDEFALEMVRLQKEEDLNRRRMAMEEEIAAHKAKLAEDAALSKNRPGGDLDK